MTDLSNAPLPTLPPRGEHSHKGDHGRALVVGGSLGMAGAPALAGMACLRSGIGLLSLAVPRCVQPTVAGYCPAYMTHCLPDDGERFAAMAATPLLELVQASDAAAIGPGLGRSTDLTALVNDLYRSASVPLVADADALNALAAHLDVLGTPGGPRILTPHAGEFARLVGKPLADPNDDEERLSCAGGLARRDPSGQTIVLLKGARTVVTDGERFAVNRTGNAGMATGGSGDVLTGVLTALLSQGLEAFDAARLAAHAHGLAGDLAAAKLGQIGMTAVDLVEFLPRAWQRLAESSGGSSGS